MSEGKIYQITNDVQIFTLFNFQACQCEKDEIMISIDFIDDGALSGVVMLHPKHGLLRAMFNKEFTFENSGWPVYLKKIT